MNLIQRMNRFAQTYSSGPQKFQPLSQSLVQTQINKDFETTRAQGAGGVAKIWVDVPVRVNVVGLLQLPRPYHRYKIDRISGSTGNRRRIWMTSTQRRISENQARELRDFIILMYG